MAPYYESLCKSLDWPVDTDLLNKMKKANEEELKRLEDELEDAEKNLGESEIRDAMMAKAEYLCRIGDKVSEVFRFHKLPNDLNPGFPLVISILKISINCLETEGRAWLLNVMLGPQSKHQ